MTLELHAQQTPWMISKKEIAFPDIGQLIQYISRALTRLEFKKGFLFQLKNADGLSYVLLQLYTITGRRKKI
jgi:hypothetical protein